MLSVVNPDTGEIRSAQVFVAVLGASSYTFAEATWSQSLPDWVGSHVRAFDFYGGLLWWFGNTFSLQPECSIFKMRWPILQGFI